MKIRMCANATEKNAGAERIAPVVRKVARKDAHERNEDLAYWLAQPVAKRLAALTFIVSQSLRKDERMNKTIVNKRKMKV